MMEKMTKLRDQNKKVTENSIRFSRLKKGNGRTAVFTSWQGKTKRSEKGRRGKVQWRKWKAIHCPDFTSKVGRNTGA